MKVTVLIQELKNDLELLNTDEDIQEPNHNKYSKVNSEQHEYSKLKADSVDINIGFQKLQLKLTLK
jgi:superfamily II helicase